MIKGKLKVAWSKKDYSKGPWRTNSDHYSSLTMSNANKKSFAKESVGVYINNTVSQKFIKLVEEHFNFENTVVALNKMTPGQMLPWHKDKCATYIKRNKIKKKKKIVRVILFLEDSKPGHQLWIGDELCYGKAGRYYGWRYGTKHMAANIGEVDRFTLQITGISK